MKQCRVLVVDDDQQVQRVVKKILLSFGYLVETVDDGKKALDLLKEKSFDLVMTDLQMPYLDGRELLRLMSEKYPGIPKIVLTGHGTNEDVIAAIKSGAYDFLYKPIDDLEILHHTIQRAIESKLLRESKDLHLAELKKINQIISMLNSGNSTDSIFGLLNDSLKKIIPFDGMFLGLYNETNTFINVENVFFQQAFFYSIIKKNDRFIVSNFLKNIFPSNSDRYCRISDFKNFVKLNDSHDVLKEMSVNGIQSLLAVSLFLGDQRRGVLFFVSSRAGSFDSHHETFLDSIAGQISLSIERTELMKEIERNTLNLEKKVLERTSEIKKIQRAMIFALSSLADARDSETGFHLERIRNYSVLLLKIYKNRNGLSEKRGLLLENMYDSSVLHDIGKVGIPDEILLKPGKLTDDEFLIMKRHPIIGYNALKNATKNIEYDPFMSMVMNIILSHHERWDGQGYPHKLKEDDIPLSARIVSIVDVYDALTSKRPYKRVYTHVESLEIMKKEKGKFDPHLFDLFLSESDEFNSIRKKYKEDSIEEDL